MCLAVYNVRRCIGFLMLRGPQGVETFDADERSLGIFSDQKTAAAAVSGVREPYDERRLSG